MIIFGVPVMPRIIVSSAKTQISIHPKAINAHLWLKGLVRQFNRNALPAPLRSELAKQPLQCIRTDESKLLLFAPLATSLLWQAQHPPEGTVLLSYTSEEMPDQDIYKAAWASALGEVFNGVHPQVLPDLRDSLSEHMSQSLHRNFFSSKKFSDSLLCALTGIARSTLTDQRRAKKPAKTVATHPDKEPSTEDVIQLLLQPRNKS